LRNDDGREHLKRLELGTGKGGGREAKRGAKDRVNHGAVSKGADGDESYFKRSTLDCPLARSRDSVVWKWKSGFMDGAKRYLEDISAADAGSVLADPEAQLTVPVSNFLTSIASEHGIGQLTLIREAQLPGVRPDFAALIDKRPCGWIELKAPGHSLDGAKWVGREKKQWELLRELDALIVTDGHGARFYQLGEFVADANLPEPPAEKWDATSLVALLRLFTERRPVTITRVSQLAARLAPLARLLRERIVAGLDKETRRDSIVSAHLAWKASVHEGASGSQFADDLAQVVAYSLAIAALRGGADDNRDGYVSLAEAQHALRGPNDVLAAALGPVLTVKGLMDDVAAEVGAIERLVSAVDVLKIRSAKDPRGEPWLWFYEDFLGKYDPKARKEAGVYYTPTPVVQCQVRLIDHILTERFGRALGFGDPGVVTLDPAAGSGTYPLAVLDQAAETATAIRGPAGPSQVVTSLAKNVFAFELMPGPYALSHLRVGQRLADLAGTPNPPSDVQVFLTDTLDDPDASETLLGLWGDQETLARERERARLVKREQPVTVVLGNPPYRRRTAESGGGWVVHSPHGEPLFDGLLRAAREANVIFSAQASLYNDYVYFWRWALWKVFEQNGPVPGVVSFITASSWLTGPALIGLRALVSDIADEVWVIDLGGDGHAAVKEENVFAIQTPVSIVTLFRRGASTGLPAAVSYRRVHGTAAAKLTALATIVAPTGGDDGWSKTQVAPGDPLVPDSGGAAWEAMPALIDLLPWQQPGCKVGRTWPISTSREVLMRRWEHLLSATEAVEREVRFDTRAHGRTIHTKVAGFPKLDELLPGAAPEPVVRYAYRSFDRRWTFQDPRLTRTESPSLWNSRSPRQVFFTAMTTKALGQGPAMIATADVPDLDCFRGGAGGRDVVPLLRDSMGTPNIAFGLLNALAVRYGFEVTPEDVGAYVYCILAHPGYQERFATDLATPGIRLPLTASPDLFREAVNLGAELLYLHTHGERFSGPGRPAGKVAAVTGVQWERAVTAIPTTLADCSFDPSTGALHVGDGVLAGVLPSVWEFSVSGLQVLPRWLGSRTHKGVGRASGDKTATPLDRIRPEVWEDEWNDELLDLVRILTLTVDRQEAQRDLLARVCDGELINASELPIPSESERQVPKT